MSITNVSEATLEEGSLTEPESAALPVLALHGITKRFPGVIANDGIDLDIFNGEVHAILGENGAGKSTLMKIVYGFYQPDAGSIAFKGVQTAIRSPGDSRKLGIGMVFQNFSLIPAFTVAENVALFAPTQGMFVDRGRLRRQVREVSERYDLAIDPDTPVRDLTMGERQKVELIKLLLADAKVLIFDEPTSVLAPHEVDGLFRVFEELKKSTYALLFITHKMREVLAVADRVTVLRRGAVAGQTVRGQFTAEELVATMLGVETGEAGREPAPPYESGHQRRGGRVPGRGYWHRQAPRRATGRDLPPHARRDSGSRRGSRQRSGTAG